MVLLSNPSCRLVHVAVVIIPGTDLGSRYHLRNSRWNDEGLITASMESCPNDECQLVLRCLFLVLLSNPSCRLFRVAVVIIKRVVIQRIGTRNNAILTRTPITPKHATEPPKHRDEAWRVSPQYRLNKLGVISTADVSTVAFQDPMVYNKQTAVRQEAFKDTADYAAIAGLDAGGAESVVLVSAL